MKFKEVRLLPYGDTAKKKKKKRQKKTEHICSGVVGVLVFDFSVWVGVVLMKCRTDEDVRRIGVEWAVSQARELKEAGVPSIHFYAMHATGSVAAVARQVY